MLENISTVLVSTLPAHFMLCIQQHASLVSGPLSSMMDIAEAYAVSNINCGCLLVRWSVANRFNCFRSIGWYSSLLLMQLLLKLSLPPLPHRLQSYSTSNHSSCHVPTRIGIEALVRSFPER